MKKKLFSIVMAITMCFMLTANVSAYDESFDDNVLEIVHIHDTVLANNGDFEQIAPMSGCLFGHSYQGWEDSSQPPIVYNNQSSYCKNTRYDHLQFNRCKNCYVVDSKIDSRQLHYRMRIAGAFVCSHCNIQLP